MRRTLLGCLLVLLLWPGLGWGAVAFRASAVNDAAGVTAINITIALNAGDTVVVTVDEALSTVSSVTGAGCTMTQKATVTGVRQTEIWGCLNSSGGSTVTVNMVGSANVNVSVHAYTGVDAFGNTGTNSGIGTNPTVSATLQDANGYIAGGFGMDAATGACSAQNGTIRHSCFFNSQASQLLTSGDNTSGATGALTFSFTTTNSTNWQGAVVELRPPAIATGRKFLLLGV